MNTKSGTGIVGFIIVLALSASRAGSFMGDSPASVDKVLAKTSVEMNKTLPKMVDDVTRLDSLMALPGQKLKYNYTITAHLNPMPSRDDLTREMRPEVVKNYRTAPALAEARKMKVTLVHSYHDMSGRVIGEFEVGPRDL